MMCCRHRRSHDHLKQEIEEVIREQNWKAGIMPRGQQLQSAGQHGLVAAIRQMGGFRSIATKIGLQPGRSDNRGRPKKADSDAREAERTAAETAKMEAAAKQLGFTVTAAREMERADSAAQASRKVEIGARELQAVA